MFKNFLIRVKVFLTLLCAVFVLAGCVATKKTADRKRMRTFPAEEAPKTLAILPFENNSVTDPDHYAPLSKGLSAMLITDLNSSGSTLKLIERAKIEALLKEIAFSQTGVVDQSTAVRIGKILGAQSIAFGSFMVLGDAVRIDVRIIKVETSELIISESITGSSNRFMALEGKLAQKIADSLRVVFVPAATEKESTIEAALTFSEGLAAYDKGDRMTAKKLFQKSIELDPLLQSQVDSIGGLQ